jgi:glycosyltransferase involved in cell wall biosynthesis
MVSIIIPIFNRVHTIEATINSIILQTSNDWECLLIDDGSSDNLSVVLDKFLNKDSRFQYFKRPDDRLKGASSCRNIGIENAKGEYIIFLDSDDILAPFCIADRIKAFQQHKNFDFLVFYMKVFFNEIPPTKSRDLNKRIEQNWLLNFLELRGSWQVTSPIYKHSFISSIGGFEEGLKNFEDFVVASKALYTSTNFKVFDNVDCFYRNDEDYHKKHKDINYISKSVNAFVELINIYNTYLLNKESNPTKVELMRKAIVNGYIFIFNQHIIFNIKFFKGVNKKIIELLHTRNYIKTARYKRFLIAEDFLCRFQYFRNYGLYRVVIFLMR